MQFSSDNIIFSGRSDDLITGFTEGSILFANANGVISEDNINFFYDDINKRIGLGTNVLENASIGSITLDTGTDSNAFLITRNDDVNHPFTSIISNPDMFSYSKILGAAAGGLQIGTLTNNEEGFEIYNFYVNDVTSKTQTSNSVTKIDHFKSDGGDNIQAPGSDANLFAIASYTLNKLIIDAEGTIHQAFQSPDADQEIINLHSTTNPIFSWQMSNNKFKFNKGLELPGGTGLKTLIGSDFSATDTLLQLAVDDIGMMGIHFKDVANQTSTSWMVFEDNSGITRFALSKDGYCQVADRIEHYGDNNTYILFTTDQIDFYAGGQRMLTLDETFTDVVVVNENGNDIDFRVETLNNPKTLWIEGLKDCIHFTSGIGFGIKEVDLPYTQVNKDHQIFAYGNGILSLQSAANKERQRITVVKGDVGGVCQIQADETEQINNANTFLLTSQFESVTIESAKLTNGSAPFGGYGWIIINYKA